MIVQLSLIIVASLFHVQKCCTNETIINGRLENYTPDSQPGDSASLLCDDGFTTYNSHLICGDDNGWVPTPICHKVFVTFHKTSMIKYVYPTPYDSSESDVSFSFSTAAEQSSGLLVRLTSKKQPDGSRDTLTLELVGGFLATTMQLSSIGERIIGFCHDDVALNDDKVHSVVLKRNTSTLTMTIDNRAVQCSYPSGEDLEFKFTALRSIQIGHLQPSWGESYGFSGCMTDLSVDGLAPLILADLSENTNMEDAVIVEDIGFTDTCGEKYVVPTTEPPIDLTDPPVDPYVVTGAVEQPSDEESSGTDKTTLIIILVTISILIILVLIIGIVCKKYYNNKGTYKVDESRLRADQENPEQEYFI